MIANYHTHSRWCRHGAGELEEYILEAISQDFTELAITEHVPHEHSFSWMPWDQYPLFDTELNRLIEKYQDQLHLIKGFECEYYPEDLDSYRRFQEDGYEMLILGQHACGPQKYNIFTDIPSDYLYLYAEDVCKGLETGLFRFLCHPDVVLYGYRPRWDRHTEAALGQIFQAAAELHIPVEINANGVRDHRAYPSTEAFLLSKKYNLTYLINSDAHRPEYLNDAGVAGAEQFAARLGLPVLTLLP